MTIFTLYLNGLVQERRNAIVLAMELHLSCINSFICKAQGPEHSRWDKVKAMDADALAPCVISSSAAILLSM